MDLSFQLDEGDREKSQYTLFIAPTDGDLFGGFSVEKAKATDKPTEPTERVEDDEVPGRPDDNAAREVRIEPPVLRGVDDAEDGDVTVGICQVELSEIGLPGDAKIRAATLREAAGAYAAELERNPECPEVQLLVYFDPASRMGAWIWLRPPVHGPNPTIIVGPGFDRVP